MTEVTFGLTAPFSTARGWPEHFRLANPAAGQPANMLIPGDRYRRILTARFSLTTDATAGTRTAMLLVLDPDGNEWLRIPATAGVGASNTSVNQWAISVGAAYNAGDGTKVSPMPSLFLQPGHTLRLSADAIVAGDTITGVRIYAEEYVIGPRGYPIGPQILVAPESES